MKLFLFLGLLSQAAFATRAPNPERTPGSVCRPSDPDFIERRYKERIPYCRRYVPPSVVETVYRNYRIPEAKWEEYTIDHLIPLALGGNNNRLNLWPEPKDVKGLRYNLENELYLRLKDGKITHATAIQRIKLAKLNPPSLRRD
jgi:hypothetical protein